MISQDYNLFFTTILKPGSQMSKALTLCFLLCASWAQAQPSADTLFQEAAVKNTIKLYARSIQGQTSLYNGSQYREPNRSNNDQHPFFDSDDWVFGTVNYDGEFYDNVPLLYDITADKIVTENYYNADQITLVSGKLTAFTMGKHTFTKLSHTTLPRSGFYQVLYDGASMVVARRQKVIREKIISQTIEIEFDPRYRYFLFKNGAYFQVKSKASVLKVLKDEKAALRQFISKNKIRFKYAPETALRRVAAQYDNLKKPQ
jgi:hypothetical protein